MRRTPSHFAGFEDGERGHDPGNVEVSRSWNRNIEEDFFPRTSRRNITLNSLLLAQ